MWGSLKKVGIFSKNVGIFEKKNGGDMWGFLIDEVGIWTQKILETLSGADILRPQNQLCLNINLHLSQKASTLTKSDVLGVKL